MKCTSMRKIWLLLPLLFLLNSCELAYVLLVEEENCERYSIYKARLIFEDELLWEKTACDAECVDLESEFNAELSKYKSIYGDDVYTEHVTYSD